MINFEGLEGKELEAAVTALVDSYLSMVAFQTQAVVAAANSRMGVVPDPGSD